MMCPDCKSENIPGTDFCASCGHDLRNLDLPRAWNRVTEHLMSDTLGDLAAGQPLNVAPSDPVSLAIHVMQQSNLECVLVHEDDRLVGILTERDVLMKAAGEKVDLNAVTVGEIMTHRPVTLREEDTLALALNKMAVGGFRHIPLEINGRGTRVVNVDDFVRHVCQFID